LSLNSELKDGSQVGLQVFQDLKKTDNRKFTIGFKKAVSKSLAFKTKIDSNFNAALFSEYKVGNGLTIQETIATNFVENYTSKGFLENNFALGIKLKYDC
jgi:hypothetical protein